MKVSIHEYGQFQIALHRPRAAWITIFGEMNECPASHADCHVECPMWQGLVSSGFPPALWATKISPSSHSGDAVYQMCADIHVKVAYFHQSWKLR